MGLELIPFYAFVSDNNNHLIRQIVISTANVTTVAGLAGSSGSSNGIGSSARFNGPYGISISADGVFLLVADTNNALVRRIIISTRSVTTLVSGENVQGVAVSSDGVNAYITEIGYQTIRQIVISTAYVTTLAGSGLSGTTNGIGTDAQFNHPYGLGISPDGLFLLVADDYNALIRQVIISTRSVSTVAGVASSSGSTNGVGTNAQFSQPTSVSISPSGTYAFVADSANSKIRRITLLDPAPTALPTVLPTISASPTMLTTTVPTISASPTMLTTAVPTISASPTMLTTTVPTISASPTISACPTISASPTMSPTTVPTFAQSRKYSFGVVFGASERQGLGAGSALLLDYFFSRDEGLIVLLDTSDLPRQGHADVSHCKFFASFVAL
jgi:hypothetical protein